MLTDPRLATLFEHAQQAAKHQHWPEAIALCQQAEALEPQEFRLPNNRANAHWLADEPHLAWQAYRRAIRLEPADPRPWRGLGNALRDLNRFEQADRAFAISRQLHPSPETAWNHSQVLVGLERYSDAWALSEQRLEVGTLSSIGRGLPSKAGGMRRAQSHYGSGASRALATPFSSCVG